MERPALDDPCVIDLRSWKRNSPWGGRRPVFERKLIVVAVFTSIWCNFLALGIHISESENKSVEVTSDVPTADTAATMITSSSRIVPDEPKDQWSASEAPKIDEQAGTCYSIECNRTASMILKHMDVNVDPCDDFYQFSCGGFINSTILSANEEEASPTYTANRAALEQVWEVIENDSKLNATIFVRRVRKLYESCMNRSVINEKNVKSFNDQFKRWPLIHGEKWTVKEFGYNTTPLESWADNTSSLESWLQYHVEDFQSRDPGMNYPARYLAKGFDNKKVKAYYNYMVDVAVMLGVERDRAEIDLKESLLFAIEIAKVFIGSDKWMWQVNAKPRNDSDLPVNQMDIVPGLRNLIGVTPMRVQLNWLWWKWVNVKIDYIDDKLGERKYAFERSLVGISEFERRDLCKHAISQRFYRGFGGIYSTKIFNARGTKNAVEIIRNIMKQYEEMLQKAEWMDEVSRSDALEILKTLKITVSGKLVHDNESDVSQITDKHWTAQWEVNAQYNPFEHTITILAGLLQYPLFASDRPLYVDYGAIGETIGHEISHAFDYHRLMTDKDRNIEDRWKPSTVSTFFERMKCIADQYANYHDNEVGLNLDGFTTLDENFADNAGLKAAYLAYDNWTKMNNPEPKLPNLDYTTRQMFWISHGTSRCIKYTTENLDAMIAGAYVYSPEKYRIIGSLSNIPEFAKDFKCPIGSPMNPAKKCPVW